MVLQDDLEVDVLHCKSPFEEQERCFFLDEKSTSCEQATALASQTKVCIEGRERWSKFSE